MRSIWSPVTDPSQHQTLILGGGLSGLMAAWHLQRAGGRVTVWEASEALGGWAQTLAWPGPGGEPGWLERGPQSLRLGAGSALERICADLNLDLRSPGKRGPRWLGKAGRRHPSPASLGGLFGVPGMNLTEKLRLLGEPFIPDRPAAEEDLRSFFARRLGEGFAREALPALVAGLLAAPPERMDACALPRLQRLEALGGLLIGALRLGPERTRLPRGGTGALAGALAASLPAMECGRRALALEALPEVRWRVHGEDRSADFDTVVLALPPAAAAALLGEAAPQAAHELAVIPGLDLRVWHSRHRMVPGWERGLGLLVHPPEGRGLLGTVSMAADDPRGVPGLLQLRTYLGGAYPVDAELETRPGVLAELRRWLPELGEALQVREEACPGAFPLLEPGHRARVAHITEGLPPGLHWLGAARFGPGVGDIAEGVEAWAKQMN